MQFSDVKNLITPDFEWDYLASRAMQIGIAELLKEVGASDE